MGTYTNAFYNDQEAGSFLSARTVVAVLIDLVHPRSVVDVGCGVGTWLAAFQEAGVEEVVGMDGVYVDPDRLHIPRECFMAADLENPPYLGRTFDLVVSIEVAEHLPEQVAGAFIDYLAGLGPVVLFSAAVPFQGGTHHVNENWPDYWAEHFRRNGFTPFDWIRPRIWENSSVEWWYRQNALLFVQESYLRAQNALAERLSTASSGPLAIVHPENYLRHFGNRGAALTVRNAVGDLRRALRARFREMVPGR